MLNDGDGVNAVPLTGSELRDLRLRAGLSLADVGRHWPGRPISSPAVFDAESRSRVTVSRARRYVEAVRDSLKARAEAK
jgi:hypothetical protein